MAQIVRFLSPLSTVVQTLHKKGSKDIKVSGRCWLVDRHHRGYQQRRVFRIQPSRSTAKTNVSRECSKWDTERLVTARLADRFVQNSVVSKVAPWVDYDLTACRLK